MPVWGIAVHLESGEPVVVGILANGPRNALSGTEVFRHRSSASDDWAQKLRSLTADLETALKRERPDTIVIKSIDWSPATRREQVARRRYQADGALLAAARRHVEVVESRSGREIATLCGVSKEGVLAEAAAAFGSDAAEPGAAAIAALVLAGQD